MRTGVNFIVGLIVNSYNREAAEKFLAEKQRGYSNPSQTVSYTGYSNDQESNHFAKVLGIGLLLG